MPALPDSIPTAPAFRPAASADHGVVLELIREYYAYDQIPFDESGMAPGLRALLSQPGAGQVFLIFSGTAIAGYLIWTFGFDLEFGGRQATITDLYLRPGFRRLGWGTKALQMLEALSAEKEIATLHLQPERKNSAALAFYTKMGFRIYDRVPLSKRLAAPPAGGL